MNGGVAEVRGSFTTGRATHYYLWCTPAASESWVHPGLAYADSQIKQLRQVTDKALLVTCILFFQLHYVGSRITGTGHVWKIAISEPPPRKKKFTLSLLMFAPISGMSHVATLNYSKFLLQAKFKASKVTPLITARALYNVKLKAQKTVMWSKIYVSTLYAHGVLSAAT